MSESGGEKTEDPTPKKLRDARKKGQVANSKDTVSSALLIGIFAYIWIAWNVMMVDFKEIMIMPGQYYGTDFRFALSNILSGILLKLLKILGPILLVTVVIGIAANYLQVGPLLAFEGLKPDLEKLNPISGMKKIFAMKNIFEFLKSCAKVIFLGILIYKVTIGMIDPLFKIPPTRLQGLMDIIPVMMKKFSIYVMMAYAIVAAIDFVFQRHNHWKSLKMTKDEVKREYKESEGDPMIKGQRRQLHKEMAMEDNVQASKKSTVVVTNPTHYAVAIFYEPDNKKLPMVTGKGQGLLAQRMIDAAERSGVPIMQNVDLARTLYDTVKVRHYIPTELIEPIAEVLRWVYEQTNHQSIN